MHYLFFDETYRETVNNKIIVVVSWAVDQGRFSDNVRRLDYLRQRGKAPILERIDSTLDAAAYPSIELCLKVFKVFIWYVRQHGRQ
jgi:hypothetical protein